MQTRKFVRFSAANVDSSVPFEDEPAKPILRLYRSMHFFNKTNERIERRRYIKGRGNVNDTRPVSESKGFAEFPFLSNLPKRREMIENENRIDKMI